jgi:hypothetical protein
MVSDEHQADPGKQRFENLFQQPVKGCQGREKWALRVQLRGQGKINGKVERSHRSDGQEFYQLLGYIGDVDLEAKLHEWERFYNVHRPHGAHNSKTPHEVLRDKL